MTDPKILRQEGENVKQYQVRLCRDKDLYGLSWDGVSELINEQLGQKYSSDKYRKWWSSYHEGYNDAVNENVTGDDLIKEYEDKILKLQKERVKLQSTKNELNKMVREDARKELFEELLIDAIKQHRHIEVPNININQQDKKRDFVFPVADPHYGAKFVVKGLMGEVLNEYNTEVFEKRMWNLLEQFVQCNDVQKINHVSLFNLSDSVDGILRMSQLQSLQLGVTDSVIGFSDFMSVWLNELSKYALIDYYSVQGNHTELRMINGKRGDFPHENVEKIITHIISKELKDNKNITVHKNESHCYVNVLGTNILATHGQDEKNLEQSIKDYSLLYSRPIDILLTGHLHHSHEKTIGSNANMNVKFIQVPSIVGIDDYSMKLKKGAKAGTQLFVFEENAGRKMTYDITLN